MYPPAAAKFPARRRKSLGENAANPLLGIIFDGTTHIGKCKAELDIVIVHHLPFACLEIVAYYAEMDLESARVYLDMRLVRQDIPQEQLEAKVAEKTAMHKSTGKLRSAEDVGTDAANELLVEYVLSRMQIHCTFWGAPLTESGSADFTIAIARSPTDLAESSCFIRPPPGLEPVRCTFQRRLASPPAVSSPVAPATPAASAPSSTLCAPAAAVSATSAVDAASMQHSAPKLKTADSKALPSQRRSLEMATSTSGAGLSVEDMKTARAAHRAAMISEVSSVRERLAAMGGRASSPPTEPTRRMGADLPPIGMLPFRSCPDLNHRGGERHDERSTRREKARPLSGHGGAPSPATARISSRPSTSKGSPPRVQSAALPLLTTKVNQSNTASSVASALLSCNWSAIRSVLS